MNHSFQRLAAPVRNQHGVAFPVALLGILAVSVTVTAVLLTATTENALSFAHKDATRDFYVSQGAVEAYVAEKGMALAPVVDEDYLAPNAPEADLTRITVRLLGSTVAEDPTWPRDSTYSVEARPDKGGRTVGVMARIFSQVMVLTNAVDAAVISGSDVNITGNTTVSNGSDSPYCAPADSSKYAIQHDQADSVSLAGTVEIKGKIDTLEGDPYGYVEEMLGTTFHNLVANANVKFDAQNGKWGADGNTNITSFATGPTPNVADLSSPQLTKYNWGCPKDLLATAVKECELDTDTAHFPIVAIDASNADGSWGTVTVNLAHAQGMLIVYNGNLNIQGNLVFKGLILVEGAFKVMASGGGANTPKIEGAIIGLGKGDGLSNIEEDPDQTIGGTPTLRYNRCAIDLVVQVINNSNSFERRASPTSAWYEVVR